MMSNSLNIAPNKLKPAVFVKVGGVNIHTKFQVILKKLSFW